MKCHASTALSHNSPFHERFLGFPIPSSLAYSASSQQQQQEVSITQLQYCDACHATIDSGVRVLRRNLTKAHEDNTQPEFTWTMKDMIASVCQQDLKVMKDYIVFGCNKVHFSGTNDIAIS